MPQASPKYKDNKYYKNNQYKRASDNKTLTPTVEYEENLMKSEIIALLSQDKKNSEKYKSLIDDFKNHKDTVIIDYESALQSIEQAQIHKTQELCETQEYLIKNYLNPDKLTKNFSANNSNDFLETFFIQLSLTLQLWTSPEVNEIHYQERINKQIIKNPKESGYGAFSNINQDNNIDEKKIRDSITANNIKMIMRIIWRLNRCQDLIQKIMKDLSDENNINNICYNMPNYIYDKKRKDKKLLYQIINAILLPCLIEQYKEFPKLPEDGNIEYTPSAGLPLKIYDEMCKPLLNASNSIKRTLGLCLNLTGYYKIAENGGITHISKTEFQTKSSITGNVYINKQTKTIIFPPEGTNNNYAARNTFPAPFRLLIIFPAMLNWLDNRIQARIRALKRSCSCFNDHANEKAEHNIRKDKRHVNSRILSEFKLAKKTKTMPIYQKVNTQDIDKDKDKKIDKEIKKGITPMQNQENRSEENTSIESYF